MMQCSVKVFLILQILELQKGHFLFDELGGRIALAVAGIGGGALAADCCTFLIAFQRGELIEGDDKILV